MEVILLEKVKNLGELGSKVKVKPGYARNYLLPQEKAVLALPDNIKQFEEKRGEFEKKESERLAVINDRAKSLQGMHITIPVLVSDEDKLYGSVGVSEVTAAITKAGGKVQKQEIQLPHGPIKELGEHEVQLGLDGGEITVFIKVSVTANKPK